MRPDVDEQDNRIDEGYEQGFNEGRSAYVSAGLNQQESHANDPKNSKENQRVDSSEIDRREEQGFHFTGGEKSAMAAAKDIGSGNVAGALRKRGPASFIIGLLLVAITSIVTTSFTPIAMFVGIPNQLADNLDSASTAAERRQMKVFRNMIKPESQKDPICKSSTKRMKCKMGSISNSALRKLSGKEIVAYHGNTAYNDIPRTGYPAKGNPTHYRIADGRRIPAADLVDELSKKGNYRYAAKIFGFRGAFNLKVRTWTGKHIHSRLYRPLGIALTGGAADGRTSVAQRLQERVKSKIPTTTAIADATTVVESKIDKHLGKARRGGTAYLGMVSGCVGMKAPKYLAAGVAAVTIAAMAPQIVEALLSPGSKFQTEGLPPETAGMIMNSLTEQTKDSDGNMTSALDSKYLQSAMGINTNRTGVNENYAPGWAVLSSSAALAILAAERETRQGCNVIMSSTAMWTAMAVDTAITAALSATIIGGIAKIAASWVASELIIKVAKEAASKVAGMIITDMANLEALENVRGKEWGDLLGASAMIFFASGAMARGVPALSVAQMSAYGSVRAEVEDFNRNIEVASLSPFDTSSKYTFLGSISHRFQMASLQNGHSGLHVRSMLANIMQAPAALLQPKSLANTDPATVCYSAEFDADTGDPKTTPCLNSIGMPYTGLLTDIDSDAALDIIAEEGWVNPDLELTSDELILHELLPANDEVSPGIGFIEPDNPLSEYMHTCMSPETGDYLFDASGCIIEGNTPSQSSVNLIDQCTDVPVGEEEGTRCWSNLEGGDDSKIDTLTTKNPRAFEAMAAFVQDYPIYQSINGFDDGGAVGSQSSGDTSTAPISGDWVLPTTGPVSSDYGMRMHPVDKVMRLHNGVDIAPPCGTNIYAASSGIASTYWSDGGGNTLAINHGGGIQTRYLHISSYVIPRGSNTTVQAGQLIAKVGTTGKSTGCHLHFVTSVNGTPQDPRDFMRQRGLEIPPKGSNITSINGQ